MKHSCDGFKVGMLVCLSDYHNEHVWKFLSRYSKNNAEIKPDDVLLIVGVDEPTKIMIVLNMRLNKIIQLWSYRHKHFDIIQ